MEKISIEQLGESFQASLRKLSSEAVDSVLDYLSAKLHEARCDIQEITPRDITRETWGIRKTSYEQALSQLPEALRAEIDGHIENAVKGWIASQPPKGSCGYANSRASRSHGFQNNTRELIPARHPGFGGRW